MRSTTLSIVCAALVIGVTSGCVKHVHEAPPAPPKVVAKQGGPPPHAPAHGYRRKHAQDGVDMVFDSGLGVYVVVGTPDCWWADSRYYRWHDGAWSIGARVSGPWTVVALDDVPSGLRGYKAKAKNGKGNGKAKGKSK
jgi:hypothetical protein